MNRLFEIVYLLLQRKCITAKELAKRFEVSVRTIYRDIDALSMAGVPVYMKKGRYGGICLLENYVMDKSLVSVKEQKEILAALESMSAVEQGQNEEVLNKLRCVFNIQQTNWLAMDFSDWSNLRQKLYEDLKKAIIHHKKILFDYYNRGGIVSKRCVCPLQLWFKDYTWYIKAYCLDKQDIRVFKLVRMQEVNVLEEDFEENYFTYEKILKEYDRKDKIEQQESSKITNIQKNIIHLKLWIDKCQGYQVYDFFDETVIHKLEDGNFIVQETFEEDEWVYKTILSLGPYAKVLEPESLQDKIKSMLKQMYDMYTM